MNKCFYKFNCVKAKNRGGGVTVPNTKKKLNEKEKSIEAEIQRLEILTVNNPEENIIEDIQVLKEELRIIRETNLRGNMLRARSQKYIDFEKPTKYFCNLEKQK